VIKKIYQTNIEVPVFFIETKQNISEYKNTLISQIEEGIKTSNLNYKTNLKGKMTDWLYFKENKNFFKILDQFFSEIKSNCPQLKSTVLYNAWGIKVEKGDKTIPHNHYEFCYSGILYLNSTDLPIDFYDLNISITPQEGTFLFFSPILKHGTKENLSNDPKYAIVFNFSEKKDWDD
jgi:hypothetical protein